MIFCVYADTLKHDLETQDDCIEIGGSENGAAEHTAGWKRKEATSKEVNVFIAWRGFGFGGGMTRQS